MFWDDVLYDNVSARCGGGDHKGSRLDLVGNDRIGCPAKRLNAADFYDVGSGASYIGAHGIEEVGKIDYVRLLGGIFDNRQPPCLCGGNHNVAGGAHRNDIKINLASHKTLRRNAYHSVVHRNFGTQRLKPFKC